MHQLVRINFACKHLIFFITGNTNCIGATASNKGILITLKIHWHCVCHENNMSQPAGPVEFLHSCVCFGFCFVFKSRRYPCVWVFLSDISGLVKESHLHIKR